MAGRSIRAAKAITLPPSSGTGKRFGHVPISIRLIRHGCTNREFFFISVTHLKHTNKMPVIEQLGSYDPMPNMFNEKLVALNLDRIKHWMGQGAVVSKPVAELLGLAGFFPISPMSYRTAWRNRKSLKEKMLENEKESIEETGEIKEDTDVINDKSKS